MQSIKKLQFDILDTIFGVEGKLKELKELQPYYS